MCDAVEAAEQVETPTLASKPLFMIQVPQDGPAEIAGIPLPDAMVEHLRANASIEPVLVDDEGVAVAGGGRWPRPSPQRHRAGLLGPGDSRRGARGMCRA